jgi:hypothetical protein
MLSVATLNVIMLSVVMVSVMAVAPYKGAIIVIYDCDHSGLYYKCVTIVTYTSISVAKGINYDRKGTVQIAA